VAYLVGRRGFRDLDVLVDERVLVPRPETEHVVEVLLDLKAAGQLPPGPVVDRGTGSGALALTLATALEGMVVGVDLSAPALEVARLNGEAMRDAGGQPVPLVQSDCLSCFADNSLAAVVANPPYIAEEDFEGLPVDVRGHEPRVALVPEGGCPASHYAAFITQAGRALAPGGWLVTEVGEGQADAVAARLKAAHWSQIGLTEDLAGIARVVHAQSG
jgi:release factor glutamine methyltransferase